MPAKAAVRLIGLFVCFFFGFLCFFGCYFFCWGDECVIVAKLLV